DRRQKIPARGALLRARNARQRLHQRLHRMQRWQVGCKFTRKELLATLQILDRRKQQVSEPAGLFAFRLLQPIETMDQSRIRRHDVTMRNGIAELAAASQHAYKKVMLTGCGTDQHADVPFAQPAKSNPVAPREPGPRSDAFIPMQDDGVVGSPFHGHLPIWLL